MKKVCITFCCCFFTIINMYAHRYAVNNSLQILLLNRCEHTGTVNLNINYNRRAADVYLQVLSFQETTNTYARPVRGNVEKSYFADGIKKDSTHCSNKKNTFCISRVMRPQRIKYYAYTTTRTGCYALLNIHSTP